MRAIIGSLVGALVLALVGGLCLAASTLDRKVAQASQMLAAFTPKRWELIGALRESLLAAACKEAA